MHRSQQTKILTEMSSKTDPHWTMVVVHNRRFGMANGQCHPRWEYEVLCKDPNYSHRKDSGEFRAGRSWNNLMLSSREQEAASEILRCDQM